MKVILLLEKKLAFIIFIYKLIISIALQYRKKAIRDRKSWSFKLNDPKKFPLGFGPELFFI